VDESLSLLPVLPWTLAAISVVLVVALAVPPGGRGEGTASARPGLLASRAGAVLLALLAVAAVAVARVGPAGELDNPVPALVVGLGWPLLLLVPGVIGLARPRTAEPAATDVRPAVLAALAVAAYLVVPVGPTRPSAVALGVGAYGLVVLAACVAFGRRTVAARFEVLGLLGAWGSLGRRLPRWAPPRGALAVLAVLLAGAWVERYERSVAFAAGAPGRADIVVLLLLALAGAGAGALLLARTLGRAGAAVLLPLALTTAAAGVTRRALISAQLLADQVSERGLDPDPLGIVGGQVLALVLVVLGGTASAVVLARRTGEAADRLPGLGVLLALTAVSAWVVLQP